MTVLGVSSATAEQAAGTKVVSQELGEVIVTARKREESIINVPVIENAVTAEQIERTQTVSITDLPKLVPGMLMGHQLLAIGTLLSIRGVGTSASDAGPTSSAHWRRRPARRRTRSRRSRST